MAIRVREDSVMSVSAGLLFGLGLLGLNTDWLGVYWQAFFTLTLSAAYYC